MLECVQAQSDTTTGTYGANLDACMNTATGVMDDCRSSCSERYAPISASRFITQPSPDVADFLRQFPFLSLSCTARSFFLFVIEVKLCFREAP
jgi:hypothetical protein